MADSHVRGLREFLLVRRGAHRRRTAAIDDGHVFRAQALGLGGDVDGGVAAADHHHAAADGKRPRVRRLAQAGNVLDCRLDALETGALGFQRAHARLSEPEKNRIEIAPQIAKGEVAAERFSMGDLDAADAENKSGFPLGKVAGHFIGGDPVLVEAARFRAGFVHGDGVTQPRQPVRRRQSGRTRADDGHAFSRIGRARERLFIEFVKPVSREPLQQPDTDGTVFLGGAHASLLAQHLCRAHTRADSAENIRFENVHCGAADIAVGDLRNETGNVDSGGTGFDTRRVITIIAARGFDMRLARIERKFGIGEGRFVLCRAKPTGRNIGFTAHAAHTCVARKNETLRVRPARFKPGTGFVRGTGAVENADARRFRFESCRGRRLARGASADCAGPRADPPPGWLRVMAGDVLSSAGRFLRRCRSRPCRDAAHDRGIARGRQRGRAAL